MKKFFILMTLLISVLCVNAQNINSSTGDVERKGNTFIQTKSSTQVAGEQTTYKYQDSKGIEYDIYITKSGACYVNKVSKKTGKEYRQYMKPEISMQICNELGREYQVKEKNKE